jgi:predicted transglutaminase-like cysteine proteinase
MSARLICATLALACIAGAAPAQTVVGRESVAGKYNRLHDYSYRPQNGVAPVTPDIFGFGAVSAGVTFYDARFRRVSNTDRMHPMVLELADGVRGMAPEQQLAAVQREVKQRVRWAQDLETMKVADLWANAGETLERGAGDSEDIAVVEMQVLKAAGWNSRDLYISIGRELGVGTHIVMLARAPTGFYVLDDKFDHPVDASGHGLFTPILTLGEGKSWVHGRRINGVASRLSAR